MCIYAPVLQFRAAASSAYAVGVEFYWWPYCRYRSNVFEILDIIIVCTCFVSFGFFVGKLLLPLPVGEIPWEIGFWDQGICSGNN